MAQLFISHSSIDNPLAERVREALADLGYESVFLDVDARDGLMPGLAWRDQLFDHLGSCDAVLLVGTPAANASQWCHSELALARWLRRPLLALLVDGSPPHELAADLQGIAVASNLRIGDQIGGALRALGLDRATRWEATRSPFPGLRSFDESLAPVFFGRERQLEQLRQLVDPPERSRGGTIVPVLGPSGSGKSSLVRAGLIASLRPAPDWIVGDAWTPSDIPIAEMALSLAHAAKRIDPDLDAVLNATECTALLSTRGGMAEYLRRIRGVAAHVPADARVLIVIDQAEELLTLTSDTECTRFFDAVTTSCEPPSPLRVVMTARTDLWDRLASRLVRASSSVTPAVLHVPPLAHADLARVVAEPARRSHLELESGLLERLVDDTGNGDALPLLAFTLARMTAGDTRRLTLAAYEATGGVQGAIATRASEVASAGRPESAVATAILQLIAFVDDRPTTRFAPVAEVSPDQRSILEELVDARLVVVRESGEQPVFAPAHEALFSAWRPLADMIERRRDDLVVRARLERRAADWREAGAGSSGLLTGIELDQARDWLSRNADLGAPDTVGYIGASKRRKRRGQLAKLTVAAIVLALISALVVVQLRNARADRRQAQQAQVGALRAIAEREALHDPAAAAIALLAARRVDANDAATSEMIDELLSSPARDDIEPGVGTTAQAAAGTRLVASLSDISTTAWDISTGSRWSDLPFSSKVAIRRDDRIVALTTQPRVVEIFDIQRSEPVRLSGLDVGAGPTLLDFSPDGSLLATAGGTIVDIWDVSDPARPISLATWRVPGSELSAIDVSDNGRVLASGDGGVLMTWESIEGGERDFETFGPPTFERPEANEIFAADQGSRVLLAQGLGPYPIFDRETGQLVTTFSAPKESSTGAVELLQSGAMDRSGSEVVVFTTGGSGFAFDASTGELLTEMQGRASGGPNWASFVQDGMVVTSSYTGSLRVWDPSPTDGDAVGSEPERALCDVFGPRMDPASWKLVMGDSPFDSPCPAAPNTPIDAPLQVTSSYPDRPLLPDALSVPEAVVVDETFDTGTTQLATGGADAGNGAIAMSVVDGRYRLTASNIGDDLPQFEGLAFEEPLGVFALSASVASTDGGSKCGVVFGDSSSQLYVTVDPVEDLTTLTWMTNGAISAARQWAVDVPDSTELTVLRNAGAVEVRLDGTNAIRLWNDAFEHVTTFGLAIGGDSGTCEFDDLGVHADPQ